MKASELRIGNMVNLGAVYKIGVVYKIDEYKFYVYDKDGKEFGSGWAKIEPIPLTEELLESFGFIVRGHLWSIDIDRYNKINYNSDQKIFFSGQFGFSIQHDIKYVHQLQNLYFALTGNELTIK